MEKDFDLEQWKRENELKMQRQIKRFRRQYLDKKKDWDEKIDPKFKHVKIEYFTQSNRFIMGYSGYLLSQAIYEGPGFGFTKQKIIDFIHGKKFRNGLKNKDYYVIRTELETDS